MRFSPLEFLSRRLGLAIDWRVRDVLEAEREATVELGKIFAVNAANLTDQVTLLERRVEELEIEVAQLKKGWIE